MMVTLRATVETDMEAVSRVLAVSYSTLLLADYPEETVAVISPLIGRAKTELLSSGTYYAAVESGQIIAVGGWTKTQPGTNAMIERLGHIRHFATDPMHLRKGAAGLILAHCLSQAKNAGMESMECLSTKTAVPFYAHFGFKPGQERDVLVAGMPFPSVEMRLSF